MKRKLVKESLDETMSIGPDGELNKSSYFDHLGVNDVIDYIDQTRNKTIDPEEFDILVDMLLELPIPMAMEGFNKMMDLHPYISEGFGEIPGKDEYLDSFNKFRQFFRRDSNDSNSARLN